MIWLVMFARGWFSEEQTSFELEFAAQYVHQEFEHRVHWAHGIGEEDEANHDWVLFVKPERLI